MVAKEDTFDLRAFLEIIKKRIGLIILITLIATITSGIVSYFFITPTYQATTQILVSKEDNKDTINNQEIQANINLVNTYSQIINSQYIIDIVGNELGLDEVQKNNLGKNITVSSVKNSQVISITVENPSQKQAAKIANTLANIFKSEIVNLMKINNVQILTVAKDNPNASPVQPKIFLNIIVTFVCSLFASFALAFLLDVLDNTLKTENDIEKELSLPVLGSVPQINEANKKKNSRKMRPYEVTSPRERRV